MSSFTHADTLNKADLAKKWSNKRANKIMDKAYSFEDAEMFGEHLERELFNVCFDLEITIHSLACLEGTMRSMQKELAELREFKEITQNTPSKSEHAITGGLVKTSKKATAPKKGSPKCVQHRSGSAPHSRRACTNKSKFKGFYSGM